MGPAGWPSQDSPANEHNCQGGAWFADDTTGRLGSGLPWCRVQRRRRGVASAPERLWEEGLQKILRTGKRVRPKTTVKGKRFRCARCHKRSPKPVKTPAPWYCLNCLNQEV